MRAGEEAFFVSADDAMSVRQVALLLTAGVFVLAGCSRATQKDVLYEFEMGGTTITVIGVMHVLPERISRLSGETLRRFEECDRLATELDPSTDLDVLRARFFDLGRSLPTLSYSAPHLAQRLRVLLLSRGFSPEKVDETIGAPLVVVYRTLEQIAMVAPDRSSEKFAIGPDSQLIAENAARGGTNLFLETVDDYVLGELSQQPAMLLTKIEKQLDLAEQVSSVDSWRGSYEALLSSYVQGDANQVYEQLEKGYVEKYEITGALADEMNRRNAGMVSQIAKMAQDGRCLVVAIGVGHLGGPRGVLAELQNAYGAKPVEHGPQSSSKTVQPYPSSTAGSRNAR